jgi:hypothetical protein
MADTYTGTVVKEVFARGSKSARDAVMLETATERLVLRRKDGHAFADPVLDGLVGRRIAARGRRTGYTLILDSWQVLDEREL